VGCHRADVAVDIFELVSEEVSTILLLKGRKERVRAIPTRSRIPISTTVAMDTSPEGLQIETEAENEVEIERETSSPQHILLHDSMVTVRLSEPLPALTVDTSVLRKDHKDIIEEGAEGEGAGTPDPLLANEEGQEEESPRITMMDENGEVLSPTGSESASERNPESRRGSDSSEGSVEGGGVNWEELEKTEEQEPRDESSDDVSLYPHLFPPIADSSVYGITARQTRTGKQSPSHESEIGNCEGPDN
jgi:hypothetical protein